jgi:hypothetical protein
MSICTAGLVPDNSRRGRDRGRLRLFARAASLHLDRKEWPEAKRALDAMMQSEDAKHDNYARLGLGNLYFYNVPTDRRRVRRQQARRLSVLLRRAAARRTVGRPTQRSGDRPASASGPAAIVKALSGSVEVIRGCAARPLCAADFPKCACAWLPCCVAACMQEEAQKKAESGCRHALDIYKRVLERDPGPAVCCGFRV